MRRAAWFAALAIFAAGCFGDGDTADTTTPSLTHNVVTTAATSSTTLPPPTSPPSSMPVTTLPFTSLPALNGEEVIILGTEPGFGYAAATGDVNGDGFVDLVVGATPDHAYVFHGTEYGITARSASDADAALICDQQGQGFGSAVAVADLDRDGYDDVLVGAGGYDFRETEGAVFLFRGGPDGVRDRSTVEADAVHRSDTWDSGFGAYLDAGDLNGDKQPDVVIGASSYDGPLGDASLYLGSSGVRSGATSGTADAFYDTRGGLGGLAMADVNGDSVDDLVLAAWEYGKIVIHPGGPSVSGRHDDDLGMSVDGGEAFISFGSSIGSAGDVNGDGYADVIVGAPPRSDFDGAAFLVLGAATGDDFTVVPLALGSALGGHRDAGVGEYVGGIGDINGDGYDDVAVAAPWYPLTDATGAVFIFLGSAGDLSSSDPWAVVPAASTETWIGTVLGGGSDLTGDSRVDAIIGEPRYGETGAGELHIYSPTAGASHGDVTPAIRTVGDGVALAQARLDALWSADPAQPYGPLEIRCPDMDRPIGIGDVFMCQGVDRRRATDDTHNLAFLVLDDEGSTSMLTRGDLADLEAAHSEAPHGLLCRDLLAGEAPGPFDLTFTTFDTPNFDTAAFLATAYWFLEGRPDRMDADLNGIPCETVLPPESIAWVWDGGLLTGFPDSGLSILDLLHRTDDLPAVPVGSRLVDFTFNLSGGAGVLIETPDGWQVWSGPGGDASWQVEVLPEDVFSETQLLTVAVLADATYVAGFRTLGYSPAVWKRARDEGWRKLEPKHEGAWGSVGRIVQCGEDLIFTGHDSASNAVVDYKAWAFDASGNLGEVFSSDSGPPGSGTPPPSVYCHDGSFMALVTRGDEPRPSGDFTYYNEIWSSPTGSDWSLVVTDTIRPAIRPRAGVGVVRSGSAFWVVSDGDLATSSDGFHWTRIDRAAAGFESDDWIDTMGGGGLGLLIVGVDHEGDPIDPVMWWTPDGRTWERIDDHPALDPWGIEIVVQPTGLMIANRRSFEEGAPVMWVYVAAG